MTDYKTAEDAILLATIGFWLIVVASVVPFVVFAAGIAVGADFSTWH